MEYRDKVFYIVEIQGLYNINQISLVDADVESNDMDSGDEKQESKFCMIVEKQQSAWDTVQCDILELRAEEGNIVNPGGHMPPGLNRGEKGEKPDNPNKPVKPDNPGTEDSADKKANEANKGTHKYSYDSLNRMTGSNIAGTTTSYTYDTLGNLVLETTGNKVVDYQYNDIVNIG